MAKTKTNVSFSLPKELLVLIDAEAKKRSLSRSKLLALAAMNELKIPMKQRIEIAM